MTADRHAKIIRDLPADLDEFHGEGHRRSALALVHAVEQLIEKDGAIGLEGPWGSGKSTVINLAQKHFTDQSVKRRHFFTFDLWLHQPDLLKLAFLEEFVAWATTKGFITSAEARQYQDRISDREVTTRIESRREFSFHGLLFILFAPLLPIAYAWLTPLVLANDAAKAPLITAWGLSINGLSIALATISAIYIIFFSAVLAGVMSKKVGGFKAAMSAAARVFSRETDHDKIKQSIRERNPTSEEFQSFFRELLSDVQKKGDRIVLVFDNIDRLPADIVSKVWSETRSIFSMRSHGKQPRDSSVTSIIPYDASYVAEVFNEGGADADASKTVDANRAEQLIRKTFDISIRVAPPISTDWRRFLDAKLDSAFPHKLPEADKYKLFKLFDVDHQERGVLPTPRNIISYVNDIASVWNQWGDQIPVAHIGLYVLQRRLIERKPSILKSAVGLNARQVRVVGADDWARSLAALYFNVAPEHAYQILLSQDIASHAVGDDSEAFARLAAGSGFAEVFPDTVEVHLQQWFRDGADVVAKLARNLSHPAIVGDHIRETWLHIADGMGQLDLCDTSRPEDYVALSRVVEHLPAVRAEDVARFLVTWFSTRLPEQRDYAEGTHWFAFFSSVHGALAVSAGSDAASRLVKSTKVPQGPAFSLGVCGAAAEHATIEFNKMGRTESKDALAGAALDLVGSSPGRLVGALSITPWFASNDFWQKMTDRVCGRLQTEQLDADARPSLIRLLVDIRSVDFVTDESKARAASQANDGSLVWHAAKAHAEGDEISAARILWLTLDSTDGTYPTNNPGNHAQLGDLAKPFAEYNTLIAELGDGSIAEVARLVSASGTFTEWMKWSISKPDVELFKTVLRAVVMSGELGRLHTKEIAQNYSKLEEILGSELSNVFLQKFAVWAPHFPKHFAGAASLEVSSGLLIAIAGGKAPGLAGLAKLVDEYFDGLNEEEWKAVFSGGSDDALGHLLLRIDLGDYQPRLGPFSAALMRHTIDVLDGHASIDRFSDRWWLLFQGLQPNTREKFARDVLVNLQQITTTPASVDMFVSTCGKLAETMPLRDHPDVALDQLVIPLISASTEAGLTFIRARGADLAVCRRSARDDVQGRLAETLVALRQSGDQGDAQAVEIAKLLGVKLPPKRLEEVAHSDA